MMPQYKDYLIELNKLFPKVEDLLEVNKERLSLVILKELYDCSKTEQKKLSRYSIGFSCDISPLPSELKNKIEEKINSAWQYVYLQGYIDFDSSQRQESINSSYIIITEDGKEVADQASNDSLIECNKFIWEHLHPLIKEEAKKFFQSGNYKQAVAESFIKVEIRVRETGGYNNNVVGVELMRRAFAATNNPPNYGPLVDQNSEDTNGCTAHLFAGAIGLYKNPTSHRPVFLDSVSAFHQIGLASLLLYEIDARERILCLES